MFSDVMSFKALTLDFATTWVPNSEIDSFTTPLNNNNPGAHVLRGRLDFHHILLCHRHVHCGILLGLPLSVGRTGEEEEESVSQTLCPLSMSDPMWYISNDQISGRILARRVLCAEDDGHDARRGRLLLRLRPECELQEHRTYSRTAIPTADAPAVRSLRPRRPHRRDEPLGNKFFVGVLKSIFYSFQCSIFRLD